MNPDPYADLFLRAMTHTGFGWDGRRDMTVEEGLALIDEAGPRGWRYDEEDPAAVERTLRQYEDDEAVRLGMVGMTVAFRLRDRCAWRWSFAVTDDETTAWLAGLGPIVEAGSGTGWWAHRVAIHGGDVVAYDLAPPPENTYHQGAEQWHPVAHADAAEAAARHPDRTLFLCWPPYGEPMAADAVAAYHAAGGEGVVFIGEGSGGCTGDRRLFDLLGEEPWRDDEDDEPASPLFQRAEERALLSWFGMHDSLTAYERRG